MHDPTTLSSDELMGLIVDARWFAAKGRTLESAEVVGVPVDDALFALAIVEVRFAAGTHEHYLVALGEDDGPAEVFDRPEVATRLAALAGVAAEGARVRSLGVEQSNSSVVLDELHVLKLYRRLEAGPNPELELLRAPRQRRLERFAGATVEMHGSRGRPLRKGHRLGRDPAHRAQRAIALIGSAELEKSARVITEELDLIDGLRRPTLLQLERAIRGEDHERRVRARGLDHRRQVVRPCRARSADQERGPPGHARETQREKGRAALVHRNHMVLA